MNLRHIALTALAYLAIALTLALLLFRCSKEDPKPQTSVVFSFTNELGTTDLVYSHAGQTVKKSFTYTRQWWSEAYIMQPGDSVSITAISEHPTTRVTILILVNGAERFVNVNPSGGRASIKGKL